MVRLLEEQFLPQDLAGEMMSALFRPTVLTRKAYPAGRTPFICVEQPFNLRFRAMAIARESQVWTEWNSSGVTSKAGNTIAKGRRFAWMPRPPSASPQKAGTAYPPGKYRMELRYKFALTPTGRIIRTWRPTLRGFPRGLLRYQINVVPIYPRPSSPLYTCHFTIPVDIVIVDPEKAEHIELVSDPNLDAAMRAAFTSTIDPTGRCSYGTASGRRDARNRVMIYWRDLPAAFAFRATLRLPDGSKLPQQDYAPAQQRILQAGSSGQTDLYPAAFRPEKPGRHNATLILSGDPDAAYRDPAIKSIWNGSLEFPFPFEVKAANEPGQ